MAFVYSMLFCLLYAVSAAWAASQPPPASGCGAGSASFISNGKSANVSIDSGGRQRSFLLHIPKSYSGVMPVALILSFHGRGKNAKSQEDLSQFSNVTFNPDAIAVYPQGIVVNPTLYISCISQ